MDALQVIAAPRRQQILRLIWDQELAAGDIAAAFEVSWSAISQHLTILRAAGFLDERRVGTSRIYRTNQAALGPLRSVIEAHWRDTLDEVKTLAEAEQRDRDGA
ncbi:MAG: ArsR/SmtB family transcription factor [Jatrophihabitantaceae bacterium]